MFDGFFLRQGESNDIFEIGLSMTNRIWEKDWPYAKRFGSLNCHSFDKGIHCKCTCTLRFHIAKNIFLSWLI